MKRKRKSTIYWCICFKRACNYLGQSAVLDYPYKLPRTERCLYLVIFPKKYTFDNYIKLFTDTGILNFPRMFGNTLFIAICSCIISTFLYCPWHIVCRACAFV